MLPCFSRSQVGRSPWCLPNPLGASPWCGSEQLEPCAFECQRTWSKIGQVCIDWTFMKIQNIPKSKTLNCGDKPFSLLSSVWVSPRLFANWLFVQCQCSRTKETNLIILKTYALQVSYFSGQTSWVDWVVATSSPNVHPPSPTSAATIKQLASPSPSGLVIFDCKRNNV